MCRAERGRLAEWRRQVVRPADGDVLEVAAGTGLDFRLYRAGVSVVATEPELRMLERARGRVAAAHATIVLVAADAQALPFRDGSFDTVADGRCKPRRKPSSPAEQRSPASRSGVAAETGVVTLMHLDHDCTRGARRRSRPR